MDTDKIIGIPLEIYLPEEKAAIETVSRTENVETFKMCIRDRHTSVADKRSISIKLTGQSAVR